MSRLKDKLVQKKENKKVISTKLVKELCSSSSS